MRDAVDAAERQSVAVRATDPHRRRARRQRLLEHRAIGSPRVLVTGATGFGGIVADALS
ncbi:hypothetical protein TPA0910_83320 [Streptomyces hygroscopicus subsp. sporocinereus]|uniref:Uncharacterized protein n=1 Tax=Streptomyces hygroscopicus TaxID=1912 RepID=A0ABQ3UE93_STRHY|nr:hypothetical protein TPA0910_83320 [Streptomyces hygroscopicus]